MDSLLKELMVEVEGDSNYAKMAHGKKTAKAFRPMTWMPADERPPS